MIKEKDFVEVEYTGRLQETKEVFDTTLKSVAEAEGLDTGKGHFHPVTIVVGEGHLMQGIDKALVGKDLGKHEIPVKAEDGFGKKSAKLIQLISTSKFKKQGVQPRPGMQVNIDNQIGVVRSVTGGRTIVDFNHPLSGKDLLYDVEVKRVVTDPAEQVKALLDVRLHLHTAEVSIKDKVATITTPFEMPEQLTKPLGDEIQQLTGLSCSFVKAEKAKEAAAEIKEEKKA
ncbi:peptidylprolyl isomerase [Candidatus Woesearchaeota archaeon]|nr:peptidylprolyl isomerase [Candidatus Woesearchaeota archaeon]